MPVGIIVDALSVLLGGLIGSVIGSRLKPSFRDNINLTLGLGAVGMGIYSTILMTNMPAVIFSLIAGTGVGLALHVGEHINQAGKWIQSKVTKGADETTAALMVTSIVVFCASGTGIYGALVSGMNGDHSILIAKSILDLFTAVIFACTLGYAVCAVSIPQAMVMLVLFLLAGLIVPHTTPEMINDFKAVGGLIMIATGLRMSNVKQYPIADMIPALILVMPVSWVWTTVVIPFLSTLG